MNWIQFNPLYNIAINGADGKNAFVWEANYLETQFFCTSSSTFPVTNTNTGLLILFYYSSGTKTDIKINGSVVKTISHTATGTGPL